MSAQPLEARLAHMEGAFIQIADRLNAIDRRFDAIDRRFDQLERTMESRFSVIDQRFTWLIGIIVATWITTILTILFHR